MQLGNVLGDRRTYGVISDFRVPDHIDRAIGAECRRGHDGLEVAEILAPVRQPVSVVCDQVAATIADIEGTIRRNHRYHAGCNPARDVQGSAGVFGGRRPDIDRAAVVWIAVCGLPRRSGAGGEHQKSRSAENIGKNATKGSRAGVVQASLPEMRPHAKKATNFAHREADVLGNVPHIGGLARPGRLQSYKGRRHLLTSAFLGGRGHCEGIDACSGRPIGVSRSIMRRYCGSRWPPAPRPGHAVLSRALLQGAPYGSLTYAQNLRTSVNDTSACVLLVRAEATSSKSPAFTSSPPISVVIPSAQADGLMTIGDAGLRATLPSQEAALQRTARPRTASMPLRGPFGRRPYDTHVLAHTVRQR